MIDQTPAVVATLVLEQAAAFLRQHEGGELHARHIEVVIGLLDAYADYHAASTSIVSRMQAIGIGRGY